MPLMKVPAPLPLQPLWMQKSAVHSTTTTTSSQFFVWVRIGKFNFFPSGFVCPPCTLPNPPAHGYPRPCCPSPPYEDVTTLNGASPPASFAQVAGLRSDKPYHVPLHAHWYVPYPSLSFLLTWSPHCPSAPQQYHPFSQPTDPYLFDATTQWRSLLLNYQWHQAHIPAI